MKAKQGTNGAEEDVFDPPVRSRSGGVASLKNDEFVIVAENFENKSLYLKHFKFSGVKS